MKMDWFYIIYYFVFTSFFYLFSTLSLPVLMLMTDNVFLAYNTLAKRVDHCYMVDFYQQSYVDRYVYYVMIMMVNVVAPWLFYNDWWWVSYLLYLTTMPCVFERMLILLK